MPWLGKTPERVKYMAHELYKIVERPAPSISRINNHDPADSKYP